MSAVRCLWSIRVFDQTRCAFGQLRKPNPYYNITLTLKVTLTLALTLTQILTVTVTLTVLQFASELHG